MPRNHPHTITHPFAQTTAPFQPSESTPPLGYYDHERIEEGIQELAAWLQDRRIAVLTGAGCSTDSGIPDYRSEESLKRKRNPIQYNHFIRDIAARRRYWARSFVGWPRFRDKQPNPTHQFLAHIEKQGRTTGLITQNVDRLHHKAGSAHVIELHGALADVRCLECGLFEARDEVQARLAACNARWHAEVLSIAPDGDVDLPQEAYDTFQMVHCLRCDGHLKPHVVFFGENVAPEVVQAAWEIVHQADALLVLGSSLTVYSGYRFVKGAAEQQKPVAIVNLGATRGDPHASLRLDLPLHRVLPPLEPLLSEKALPFK
jgi:NAD-dependent SIR2 family protein deacetylase